MTWGLITDVAAPAEVYDAMHSRLMDLTGGKADGLLVHVARATETGFQIVDVWESREHFERYQTELIGPLLGELTADAPAGVGQETAEFDIRGLVVPAAGIAV